MIPAPDFMRVDSASTGAGPSKRYVNDVADVDDGVVVVVSVVLLVVVCWLVGWLGPPRWPSG